MLSLIDLAKQNLIKLEQKFTADLFVYILSFIVYLLLLLSVWHWTTVILMHAFPFSLYLIIYRKLDKIHTKGLINYLPHPLQLLFREISIFDVLCNIWFVPRISLYIKRLFLPFFVKMTREEAYLLFQELDAEVAAKLDTKGVVNILPTAVARLILPKNTNLEAVPRPIAEDIKVLSYNDHGIKMTRPKTELLSSGSRRSVLMNNRINEGISDITTTIPTLEPVISKILGNQFRQLMSIFSQKALAISSLAAGGGILLQIFLSKYARKWVTNLMKFSLFSGSFALLSVSVLGLVIKFIHNRVEEPSKNESDQVPKIFRGIRQIKSRFKSKADRNSFFNPDLKMAS